MNAHDAIQTNHWSKLPYLDPRETLIGLRAIQKRAANSSIPKKAANLRRPSQKHDREGRDAALFCYGMSQVVGHDVLFALVEDSDYDFVARWVDGDVERFAPVQLKELVPETLNREATLEDLIEQIASDYPDSVKTTFAVKVNRKIELDLLSLEVPAMQAGGLWVFGATSPDQQEWFLAGDLLADRHTYAFLYPE